MEKFKIGLIGPNNLNKLKLIDRLTSIDLSKILEDMEDNSIYTLNHYKVYSFSDKVIEPKFVKIISSTLSTEDIEILLDKLNKMDLTSAFRSINSYDFIEDVEKVYLELPISEDIELNNIFGAIEIYENRGFLEGEILKEDILGNSERVNRILFSALDFTKNSKKYLEATNQQNTINSPFIIKDGLKPLSKEKIFKTNILRNAEYKVLKYLDKYFRGYVVL